MNQATLVRDLKQLEDRALKCACGTDCFPHISRVRELAENGIYPCYVGVHQYSRMGIVW